MSLSLDFLRLLSTAFNLINGLWPIFVIPIGFVLGLGLLAFIVSEIKSAARMKA